MTIHLIAFISSVVLYAACCALDFYTVNKTGRRYQLLGGISEILNGLVFISFGWWFLDVLADGVDSGIGWWLLFALIGIVISAGIRWTVKSICQAIWKGERAEYVQNVKAPKWIKTTSDISAFLFCILTTATFSYCLVSGQAFVSIAEKVLAILAIILFGYGIVHYISLFWETIRHK